MPNLNIKYIREEIFKAYEYARDAHEGQYRLSGEPYISHPVEATMILLELKPDIFTIQSCLLHDVIEDTPKTKEDIEKEFGKEVAFLCEGLSKLSKVRYKGEDRSIGSLRKMFVAMAEDLRVIFVKLSDRLHNMRTLKSHPKPEKRQRIALETLNIYAPIADRLGLFGFKNNLEEECFKILDPESYKELKRQFREIEPQRRTFMKNVESEIDKILKGKVENYEIDYRVKSIYSIHKKLLKKGLTHMKELFDVFGVRVMVETEADCYKVLGIIHNTWTPIPRRFKDYIALPKPNGYKSLHTSIIGLFQEDTKQPTEIQIKTYEMKEYADIGVAAHFEYKEKGSKIAKDIDWVKELKDMVDSIQDSDFVGSLKVDLFKDRIYVFTPQGDFINLPFGSTPIDFAYAVHSELGDHITVAKVNGIVYPLDKELNNGDVVEVITDKNRKPTPFWISFVKTVKAKNKIKSFLRKEDKEIHRERGKEILSKYLEKFGFDKLDKDLSILKNIDGKTLGIEERWSLLEQVGDFSYPASTLLRKIQKSKDPNFDKKEKRLTGGGEIHKENEKVSHGKQTLIIGGEVGLDYKICSCCKRKLGKDIVAHINNKGVITIHKRNCKILNEVNKDRLLTAYIDGEKEESIIYEISFIIKNETGVLNELTSIIYSMKIDVDSINTEKIGNSQRKLIFGLKIFDYEYMIIDRLLDRIRMKLGDRILNYFILGVTKE
ncbi:bifunctional (p)ppGpp synthetase/guanosine-3',5'-bis(diphosphate) 3'-pyrophosphohydrolase [Candidatus Gracilibacteria bacterium]|nr:bifunctional (p)ppGpp synthetase/guanosine-3',5'-bis(diphosphate) 3'-pyrophosphohydrolase [Candidatus Gracilibacteria bacterium]